jgi:aspartate-semialdehyde dehydrogenase
MKKIKVGILGATGMVGQRLISLLHKHPWFKITVLAASSKSAGKTYKNSVKGRWKLNTKIPSDVEKIIVLEVQKDFNKIISQTDFIFSSLDMDKEEIKKLEEKFASKGIPVISTNSAHRWSDDVPMIIPEINSEHLKIIPLQKKKRGWNKGFIVVKPNCSIQTYVPILDALKKFKPYEVNVTSIQAISGAGKSFKDWPEMIDNVIPYIGGEEEKSEMEPMKIWGKITSKGIKKANSPKISATCIRIPVTDGHMADVSVSFGKKLTKKSFISAIKNYNKKNPLLKLKLPTSPKEFIKYFNQDNKPQTKLQRDLDGGMSISLGRLREGTLFNWKFIALSHNTLRGAAGGALLTAELCYKKGLIKV